MWKGYERGNVYTSSQLAEALEEAFDDEVQLIEHNGI